LRLRPPSEVTAMSAHCSPRRVVPSLTMRADPIEHRFGSPGPVISKRNKTSLCQARSPACVDERVSSFFQYVKSTPNERSIWGGLLGISRTANVTDGQANDYSLLPGATRGNPSCRARSRAAPAVLDDRRIEVP
jgi:hypothetical protein